MLYECCDWFGLPVLLLLLLLFVGSILFEPTVVVEGDEDTDWAEHSLPPPPPPLSPVVALAMITLLPTLSTSPPPVAFVELVALFVTITDVLGPVLYRTALLFELVGNVNDDCDIAEVEGIAMVAPTVPRATELDGTAVTVPPCMGVFAGEANVRFLLTGCCEDVEITLYSFGEMTTALPLTVLLVADGGRRILCFGTAINFCPGESLRTTGIVKLCPLITAVAVVPAEVTIPVWPVAAPTESCPWFAELTEVRSLVTIVFMAVTPVGRAVRAPVAVFTT